MAVLIATERLLLSEIQADKTQFVFDLFNDPDCIRFIGDRGIKNLEDAQNYMEDKLINSYRQHGYGLFQVSLKGDEQPLGICGLVKRDTTNPPDIGFAFLPAFRSQGYCTEAAKAVLKWTKESNISDVVLAYTNPENAASIQVLEKLGLEKQSITVLPGQDFESLIMRIKLS